MEKKEVINQLHTLYYLYFENEISYAKLATSIEDLLDAYVKSHNSE